MAYDPDEVARFDRLADEWWDPHGRFRPLHRINPLRLDYVERQAGGLAGKRVLDVGCGGGLLAEAMAKRGAQVDGIDRSPKAIAVARRHAEREGVDGVRYAEADAEAWAETHEAAYDLVTCLEVLEHVPDPAATVAACARMLAPGGAFVFATINRTPKAFLLAIVGAEYVLGWLPKGTHRYAKLLKPSELVAACRAAGLVPRDLTGMRFDPLRNRFELGRDLSVNYLGCAVKPAG